MKKVIIVISVLSTIVAIYPIIFEGALKKDGKSKLKNKIFKAEFSKVNRFGWVLVLAIALLNFFNGLISYKSYDEEAKKQKALELEKENIFTHLQGEVEDNLLKTIYFYDSVLLMRAVNSSKFTMIKLSENYTIKYTSISDQRIIIRWLTQTAEAISIINRYIDQINNNTLDFETRKENVKLFLKSVRATKKYLYSIYGRIYKLHSYKEYESLNFQESPKINYDTLNYYIFLSTITRPDL
jgi:hypothetical protein